MPFVDKGLDPKMGGLVMDLMVSWVVFMLLGWLSREDKYGEREKTTWRLIVSKGGCRPAKEP